MPQLFDIKRVEVGPRSLSATVELAPSAPLMTDGDPEGTQRLLELMPGLADHACLGDADSRFGAVAEHTELAHLLEHVAVELLARTDAAGDIASGQTVEVGERTYQITLSCVDDVLVAGALSSAAWMLQWAYSGGGDPRPDVDAIAAGLVDLVASLGPVEEDAAEEAGASDSSSEPVPEAETVPSEPAADDRGPDADDAAEESGASDDTPAEPEAPSRDPWGLDDAPRPHLVR